MSISHNYANFTKRQRFGLDALGGGAKRSAFGYTLASRAFHLLLDGYPLAESVEPFPLVSGSWAGDSVAIVGDDQVVPDWGRFEREFADVEADAIVVVLKADGFEQLGEAAQRDKSLYMQLCYLVASRQALELEPHLRQLFGARFMHRYKELSEERGLFHPKNLAAAEGR